MDERTQDFGASGADYATGSSADLYAGEGSVSEAEALEARAREIRTRAAETAVLHAEREAVEHASTRSREAAKQHQVAMFEASQTLGHAIGNAIEISALLTWSPGKIAEADRLVSIMARHLADFRSNLMTASEIGATIDVGQEQARDPHADLGELYETALTRMREVHRQTGALISLLEMDMTNTPALVAMARSVDEATALANVSNRSLSIALGELGMTR